MYRIDNDTKTDYKTKARFLQLKHLAAGRYNTAIRSTVSPLGMQFFRYLLKLTQLETCLVRGDTVT